MARSEHAICRCSCRGNSIFAKREVSTRTPTDHMCNGAIHARSSRGARNSRINDLVRGRLHPIEKAPNANCMATREVCSPRLLPASHFLVLALVPLPSPQAWSPHAHQQFPCLVRKFVTPQFSLFG